MTEEKTYWRTFKLGRLYFRFIAGTPLEKEGWTSEKLATWLEDRGFIKRVTLQSQDANGKYSKGIPHYIECAGKQIRKSELIVMLTQLNAAKGGVK